MRIFVLYIGKIVLKNVVHKRIYNHLLLLNVGLSILLNSKLICELEIIEKARSIFQLFISDGINIYGPAFSVYNVHSLIHLPDDAINNGSLESISAFDFENYLQHIKIMVKGGKLPLVQIVNKVIKESNDNLYVTTNVNYLKKNIQIMNFILVIQNSVK